MKNKLTAIAAILSLCIIPSVQAADIKSGSKLARQCAVCHGKNGIATNPEAPNLAGESAIYIEKQLVAFKTGERNHRQMSIIAKGLEIEKIKDLAAWYAAMEVTVILPDLGD